MLDVDVDTYLNTHFYFDTHFHIDVDFLTQFERQLLSYAPRAALTEGPAAAALPPCPTGSESSAGSINDIAKQRFNQMITNRVLATVLLGINEQINCDDCVSAFGSAGSFSAGIHGRKNITLEPGAARRHRLHALQRGRIQRHLGADRRVRAAL